MYQLFRNLTMLEVDCVCFFVQTRTVTWTCSTISDFSGVFFSQTKLYKN